MTPFDDATLDLSAVEQARRIRVGDLDAEELVELYLARIGRLDPTLSAFVQVDAEGARREARRKDRLRGRGDLPPFFGVPIGIKDLNLARGLFARFGSRAFERFVAFTDDETTGQLRRGGFIVLGKTSTSELGTLPITEPDIHPPTRNPWNLERSAGGSSGGSASAVASGMLPIAQASDGAGSIRIPASFCGLYGLKPSRGRVPNPFNLDDRRLIYTMGPIGRSVEDVAAMLDVMAGIGVGKPHWAPLPPRPFQKMMHETPPPPLRIRLVLDTPLAKTHPEVREATLRAARLLEELGHRVEEGAMVDGSIEEFLPVWQFTAASAPVHDWKLTQPTTQWLAAHGKGLTRQRVDELQQTLEKRVLAWFSGFDLVITPTVPRPPPRIGAWKHLEPEAAFAEAAQLGPFTAPFNVSGQPAASLPVAVSSEGLPIGVQLVGGPHADALVLQISRAIEVAWPWKDRRAPGWKA